MEYKSVKIENLKMDAEGIVGSFKAYGAYFGNTDYGGDILEPGCFKKIERTSKGRVVVPLMHDMGNVIGDCDVEMDQKGLKVSGELFDQLSSYPDTKVRLANGVLSSMSVGFRIMKNGAKWSEDYMTRTISKAHLFEVSLVVHGMNPKAKVTSVKDINGSMPNIREFEQWLQLKGGFSRKESIAIASVGYKAALSDSANRDKSGTSESERIARESLGDMMKHINIQSIL